MMRFKVWDIGGKKRAGFGRLYYSFGGRYC